MVRIPSCSFSGIGKAICSKLLTDYDDTVVFLGSRDASRGQQAVQDLVATCGEKVTNRLHYIPLDTSSNDSVTAAAQHVQEILQKQKIPALYGICNNAGVLGAGTVPELINVNFFGPQRVNNAFAPLMTQEKEPQGRIVNIASGGAPNFVQNCQPDDATWRDYLTAPWTIPDGIPKLNKMVQQMAQQTDKHESYGRLRMYGFSKAALNAYTWWLAHEHPQWLINSVSPGWIQTEMTVGQGASKSPEEGAIPPVYLLMSPDIATQPAQGRYYGSDCQRSPMHTYRDPGEAPYDGPDGP
uniref:Protochlorophyllide reductase n=1 Tax=Entomoneis paludosa TaxID=265537 RepID=A0A7S3DXJ3_9STRA|mmetsp:Transcript_7846/g.16353  ORF Transcript_7846/g.16353 Transcript_7846/m.16353 type:complete len:297 (+) Transcript_7846:297-1187(+)